MKRRYSTLLGWLKRNPTEQKRIDRLYESYATEIKRRRKEAHKNFE